MAKKSEPPQLTLPTKLNKTLNQLLMYFFKLYYILNVSIFIKLKRHVIFF